MMQEQARMMAAWERASAAEEACVLATVVATRGSSYRSPGARMLILPDGSRIGAISGGCLEGEVCRRAHWWTAKTPAMLKTFDTSTQEDNEGFGLGCGGGLDLLLERLAPATRGQTADGATDPLLARQQVNETRAARSLAVVVQAAEDCSLQVGERFDRYRAAEHAEIARLLKQCEANGYSFTTELREGVNAGCQVFVESLTPPLQLLVCGAGMDAEPVVAQAAALGWSVLVLDQRADLARPSRFPLATGVVATNTCADLAAVQMDDRTAAIVMSHSFAQDSFFLEAFLSAPLRYLGVLGSRRRTMDLLAQLGHDAMPPNLYAPAGLDIGAETPEQIALSIVGEIHACFAHRQGGALRHRAGSIHGREDLPAERREAAPARVVRDCLL